MTNPQRTPATQSRPMEKAAAGGLIARSVGFPAGGRRTAAMFSSLGVAACNSILARNRQIVNAAVRRLGFAPIPGRRFNSNPGAFRGERAAWKADTHDSCSSIPPIVDRRRRKGWINGEAGVAPGRARIIPAPPSRRLGVGRVSLGKHSARPTPFFLAIGE